MKATGSQHSMTKKERAQKIIEWFSIHFQIAETELRYNNPFELLVAVILSAQCTDKRVNLITPELFRHLGTAEKMAASSVEEIFTFIRSVSYPNNKAKHLYGMANKLISEYGGTVPEIMDELTGLPGVGRKTANVILSVIYNQPTMAVDTHVFRVSKRMGIVSQTASTPLQVETQLYKLIPEDLIPKAHHWLILHGRYVCKARNPECHQCGLSAYCRYFEKKAKATNSHV